MAVLYSISIFFYGLGIRVVSLFNPKARQWVKGRQRINRRLKELLRSTDNQWKGTVWFHCASLGEFEQGRPVMERFREAYPEYRIILTFYSPSGYEVRKNYPGAEGIFYLPLDTPGNARRWVRILKPKLVFFIKYEYWFNFLGELNRQNIPVFIISAIFHRNQPFFKGYGEWFRKQLKNISWFFIQSEEAKDLIESLGIKHYTITGDTRFDRVYEITQQQRSFPEIEKFRGDTRIFLGGSTWEPDEAMILDLIGQNHPDLKFIIAPHEVHPSRILELKSRIEDSGSGIRDPGPILLYSKLTSENAASARILILDSIGILAHLYQYATFSMIGGGFGVSIHNTLEAAAFGNPVMFGPNYRKFTEACDLISLGGAFCINRSADLSQIVSKLLKDTEELSRVSNISRTYVENGRGATNRILQGIQNLGFIAPSQSKH
ncbi:MAG: 3-deoxy-D-manno-octulosonic acid transferase [Bacteroidales bacterium]|nr:3-deoxy-D-manno-octulosonic acid transferase [Bacteroidales bacterium]